MAIIRWTEQAVADLREVRAFIARDSPRYGRLVAEQIFQTTSRLATFPLSGRVVPELGRSDVRELIVGDYRLVYRVASETVTILTIFRSSRLLPPEVRVP